LAESSHSEIDENQEVSHWPKKTKPTINPRQMMQATTSFNALALFIFNLEHLT